MKPVSATIDGDASQTDPATLRSRDPTRGRTGGPVRDLRGPRNDGGFGADDAGAEPFRLGWLASAFLNLVLLGAPLGLVVALPPVLECREREARFGFFAGETLKTCSSRGITQRLTRLDDRIKMLVRRSGV